jgi:hypothetical protein
LTHERSQTLNTIFAVKFGKYNKGPALFLSVVFLLTIGFFAFVVNQIARLVV